jgi:hypothetical protein
VKLDVEIGSFDESFHGAGRLFEHLAPRQEKSQAVPAL